ISARQQWDQEIGEATPEPLTHREPDSVRFEDLHARTAPNRNSTVLWAIARASNRDPASMLWISRLISPQKRPDFLRRRCRSDELLKFRDDLTCDFGVTSSKMRWRTKL